MEAVATKVNEEEQDAVLALNKTLSFACRLAVLFAGLN